MLTALLFFCVRGYGGSGEVEPRPNTAPKRILSSRNPCPCRKPLLSRIPFPCPFPDTEVGVYNTTGMAQTVPATAESMWPAGVALGFGVDATWFFAQHWGIAAGAEVALFSVPLFTVNTSRNPAGTAYTHKQNSHFSTTHLRIPLWLRFRTSLLRHQFYAAAGLSLDLTGRYRTEEEPHTAAGEARYNVTTGPLQFGNGLALHAETGLRWNLGECRGLYVGLYAGYDLQGVRPAADALSLYSTERMPLLSAGVMVRISFGFLTLPLTNNDPAAHNP
jgi:hypothetical protein